MDIDLLNQLLRSPDTWRFPSLLIAHGATIDEEESDLLDAFLDGYASPRRPIDTWEWLLGQGELAIAEKLLETPAFVEALASDGLNQPEDDLGRRRGEWMQRYSSRRDLLAARSQTVDESFERHLLEPDQLVERRAALALRTLDEIEELLNQAERALLQRFESRDIPSTNHCFASQPTWAYADMSARSICHWIVGDREPSRRPQVPQPFRDSWLPQPGDIEAHTLVRTLCDLFDEESGSSGGAVRFVQALARFLTGSSVEDSDIRRFAGYLVVYLPDAGSPFLPALHPQNGKDLTLLVPSEQIDGVPPAPPVSGACLLDPWSGARVKPVPGAFVLDGHLIFRLLRLPFEARLRALHCAIGHSTPLDRALPESTEVRHVWLGADWPLLPEGIEDSLAEVSFEQARSLIGEFLDLHGIDTTRWTTTRIAWHACGPAWFLRAVLQQLLEDTKVQQERRIDEETVERNWNDQRFQSKAAGRLGKLVHENPTARLVLTALLLSPTSHSYHQQQLGVSIATLTQDAVDLLDGPVEDATGAEMNVELFRDAADELVRLGCLERIGKETYDLRRSGAMDVLRGSIYEQLDDYIGGCRIHK